ncbi:hypothetical protein SDC9_82665 [bioreactor metagenome]|uniref:Uncharacterized protein n=1 Tax=bioreactor metagenome TaxID=1076179 RepID=A0A644Z5I1_9ZZZZ
MVDCRPLKGGDGADAFGTLSRSIDVFISTISFVRQHDSSAVDAEAGRVTGNGRNGIYYAFARSDCVFIRLYGIASKVRACSRLGRCVHQGDSAEDCAGRLRGKGA